MKVEPRPELLAPAPGTVGRRVHFDGSFTRIDGGGRCALLGMVGPDGSSDIVVRLYRGRSWHRAVPAPSGRSSYELQISSVKVVTQDATFAAVRRAGGSCMVVVLQGQVEVTGLPAGAGMSLTALEMVVLSARGEAGPIRSLTTDDVIKHVWLKNNLLFDSRVEALQSRSLETKPQAGGNGPSRGNGQARKPPLALASRREGQSAPAARAGRGSVTVSSSFADPTQKPTGLGLPGPATAFHQGQAGEHLRPPRTSPAPASQDPGQRNRRLAAVFLALFVGGALALAHYENSTALLTVNRRQVRLPRSRLTVASALRVAKVSAPDGALYSAGTHKLVDPHFSPAKLLVNGSPASRTTRVQPGDRIQASPGADAVEATAKRQVDVAPPPHPPVEYELWDAGKPGREDQVYGTVSGEVLSRAPVLAPVPPRPVQGKVVALTFDDGPHREWTPQILAILRAEGVKATFCVVGEMGKKHPDLVRAERDAGHALCNHTENHIEHLDRAAEQEVVEEVEGGYRFLQSALGTPPSLYRPPGGHLGPIVITVVQRNGMRVLHWTVDSSDHKRRPANAVLNTILQAVRPGAIILLHDGGGDRSQTVAMLRPLIRQLKAKGYGFATPLDPVG